MAGALCGIRILHVKNNECHETGPQNLTIIILKLTTAVQCTYSVHV